MKFSFPSDNLSLINSAKEQRVSAVGEWVNVMIASFHHKAIPP